MLDCADGFKRRISCGSHQRSNEGLRQLQFAQDALGRLGQQVQEREGLLIALPCLDKPAARLRSFARSLLFADGVVCFAGFGPMAGEQFRLRRLHISGNFSSIVRAISSCSSLRRLLSSAA